MDFSLTNRGSGGDPGECGAWEGRAKGRGSAEGSRVLATDGEKPNWRHVRQTRDCWVAGFYYRFGVTYLIPLPHEVGSYYVALVVICLPLFLECWD